MQQWRADVNFGEIVVRYAVKDLETMTRVRELWRYDFFVLGFDKKISTCETLKCLNLNRHFLTSVHNSR